MLRTPAVVSDWATGISADPFRGFEDIVGLNVIASPGCAMPDATPTGTYLDANAAVKLLAPSSSTSGYFFGATDSSTGQVWRYNSSAWDNVTHSGGQTTGTPLGLAHFNGRLFLFVVNTGTSTLHVDYFTSDAAAGGAAIDAAWVRDTVGFRVTSSEGNVKPTCVGDDGNLYIGNGSNLMKMDTSFNVWGAGASTSNVLDLPPGWRIRSLTTLGGKLLIGAVNFGVGASPVVTLNQGAIFPWDYSSDSFDYPLVVPTYGVWSMVTYNNTAYFMGRNDLRIFTTNGSSFTEVAKVPSSLFNDNQGLAQQIFPQSLAVAGRHLVAVFGSNAGSSGPVGAIIKYDLSTGAMTRPATAMNDPRCVVPAGFDDFIVGSGDTSSGDYLVEHHDQATTPSGSYTFTAKGRAMEIGTYLNPETCEEAYFELNKPLESGQQVALYYRSSRGAGYTLLATFDYATYGAAQFGSVPCSATFRGMGQLQVILTGATTTLRSVTLR